MIKNKFPLSITLTIIILSIINYAVFRKQYSGNEIFPWDFVGGYHFQSYTWYEIGDWWNPPRWFPWGDVGFPSAIAIQSGGWYIPLGILDALNIPYTFTTAAILQVLHVLVGSLGCFFLCRSLGIKAAYALLAAVGYHFTAAFYSNQQHVDIVRAYAIFPWLLWCINPSVLRKSIWMHILSSIILFQFLTSAYPGNIVSAAYACAALFLTLLFSLPNKSDRRNYFLSVTVVVLAGSAFSQLKWLPYFSSIDLLTKTEFSGIAAFNVKNFLTLWLRYDRDFIGSDITMRSIFIPMAAWSGVFFIRKIDKVAILGITFTLFALFFGYILPTLSPSDRFLPGLNLSRFPLSDWRMVLSIGLILLGCAGWKSLLDQTMVLREALIRCALMSSVIIATGIYASHIGYAKHDLLRLIPPYFIFIALALLSSLNAEKKYFASNKIFLAISATLLILTAIADGWQYQNKYTTPWRAEWSQEKEIEFFGKPINSSYKDESSLKNSRRPARFIIGNTKKEIIDNKHHISNGKCWYFHEFCILGYNNLKKSIPHQALLAGIESDSGPGLLNFLRQPSQLLIVANGDSPFDISRYTPTPAEWAGNVSGVEVQVLAYQSEKIKYRIATPVDITVIENEMWWPGWSLEACSNLRCETMSIDDHSEHYLRKWSLPAGEWTVTLKYQQSGYRAAWFVAFFGLIILFAYAIWLKKHANNKSTGNC